MADLGRLTLGIAVLGVAACTSDDTEPPARPTDEPLGDALGGWRRVDFGFVSAYVLVRSSETVVVDTGVEGSADQIRQILSEAGATWTDVGHVILTHKHPDHVGAAQEVFEQATQSLAYAGAGDIPAIQVARDLTAVGDGDEVAGLRIVATPGHTPGHISVLDPVGRVFVAGDAINGAQGGVAGPNEDFTEDMDAALASVEKIGALDFDVALFGHGEPVTSDAASQVAALDA